MNYETELTLELQRGYSHALHSIFSDQFKHYSDRELENLLENSTVHLAESEAEEILGLVAGLATSFAPTIIKGIGGLFKKGKKKVKQVQQKISNLSQGDAMQNLLKLVQNPQFLATLAGNLVNAKTGQQIGKTESRIIIEKGYGREVNDISLEAYMNAIGYLAQRAAGRPEAMTGRQEFSYLTDEHGRLSCNPMSSGERAELLIAKLFGAETAAPENEDVPDFDTMTGESFYNTHPNSQQNYEYHTY